MDETAPQKQTTVRDSRLILTENEKDKVIE